MDKSSKGLSDKEADGEICKRVRDAKIKLGKDINPGLGI